MVNKFSGKKYLLCFAIAVVFFLIGFNVKNTIPSSKNAEYKKIKFNLAGFSSKIPADWNYVYQSEEPSCNTENRISFSPVYVTYSDVTGKQTDICLESQSATSTKAKYKNDSNDLLAGYNDSNNLLAGYSGHWGKEFLPRLKKEVDVFYENGDENGKATFYEAKGKTYLIPGCESPKDPCTMVIHKIAETDDRKTEEGFQLFIDNLTIDNAY